MAVALATAGGLYLSEGGGSSGATALLKAARMPTPSPATNLTPGPVRDAAAGFAPSDFASTSGRITSPSTGGKARDCEYVTGTAAALPPGQTLVVGMHNLNGGDQLRYLQVTFGFEHPQQLTRWRSAQYFNDQAVGQNVLLELIRMPLTPALIKADNDQRYDVSSALAAKGQVLAAVTVVHVKKHNPHFPCAA